MNVNPKSINSLRAPTELNLSRPESKPGSTDSAPASGSTNVTLSPRSRQLSELADVVGASSDVREDLVAQFKAQISAGTYQVDTQTLAANMVKEG